MLLILAAIGALIWFVLIFVFLRLRQSPEAQIRKRLNAMIDRAEEQRAKKFGRKKNLFASSDQELKETPLYDRIVKPISKSVETQLQKITPDEIKRQLEDKIFLAGKLGTWSLGRLATFWVLSIGIFLTLAMIVVRSNAGIHPSQKVLILGIGTFMGAAIPFAVLNSKIRQRQRDMRTQLPEFLDLLCVSVQAGLSFDGAVAKMTRRLKGPLIDEFKRMQNDVSLGMTHQYALTAMARRCDIEEIYLFTNSVIQAEKLGTSMTRTLKIQADNMRDRHRQWVKSQALRAPVKMMFPMVIFIFPSMFIILLFPAVYDFIQTMSNK